MNETEWMIQWFTHSKQSSLLATYWHNNVVTCRRAYWTYQWTNLNKSIHWTDSKSVGWIKTPSTTVRQCPTAALQTNTRWRKKGRIFLGGKSDLSRTSSDSHPSPESSFKFLHKVCKHSNTENEYLTWKCTQKWLQIAKYSLLKYHTWWHVYTTLLHYLPRI